MTYGYYIEGVSGGCKIKHTIEGCKTRAEVERKAAEYKESFKVCELGRVIFTYKGGERKYFKHNYKVVDRFNSKAFFEYWS